MSTQGSMLSAQQDLDGLLACAVGFVVIDGAPGVRASAERVMLRSTDAGDLAGLRAALRVVGGGHCMCAGDATLRIEAADGSTTQIGLHHGTSIRWPDRWRADARLVSPSVFADFFAALGWPRYRDELDGSRSRVAEDEAALTRWIAAIPAPLHARAAELVENPYGTLSAEQVRTLLATLSSALGSEEASIAALLRWFGQGRGPWSGFPAYEAVAATLLMQFKPAALTRVLAGELDDAQLRGAARLCASFDFRRHRKALPLEVVQRLRQFLDASGGAEQHDAFLAAFSRALRSPA